MIQVVNKLTGEIYELETDTPLNIRTSWQLISETIKALERAKDKLKPEVEKILDEKGQYDFGDMVFKQISVQRSTYDKSVMRRVFDEDTMDLLLVPDKTAVDNYLKEHLDEVGAGSTELRKNMIPVGKAYNMLRLEKLKRDED